MTEIRERADDVASLNGRLLFMDFGITLFFSTLVISVIACAICWLYASEADFLQTRQTWNCLVSSENRVWLNWYCMPGPLRLSALSAWSSTICLVSLLINRIVNQIANGEMIVSIIFIKLSLAFVITGFINFLIFYISEYVMSYGGWSILLGMAISAFVASKAVFPKLNPLWLVVPLMLGGIFSFAVAATVTGIVFDV